MPIIDTILNGVVVQRHNDDDRLYSEWLPDGTPLVIDEPYTPEQNAEADGRATRFNALYNEATLHDRARTALNLNNAWLSRTGTPTNLQILNHIDLLTKENSAVIRLLVRALDTIEGT